MLKMTSAYASKLLKKLTDERNYLANIENDRNTYFADEDTEPIIPDYDYHETKQNISDLNEKIMKIRHAVNLSNATTVSVSVRQTIICYLIFLISRPA